MKLFLQYTFVTAIILFLSLSTVIAQTGSLRTGIQSPNAAALGEYGEVPVNFYTGIPNISIPLFSGNSTKYSMPISLSYHAGGMKVEEIASWVGLGWTLNAGGAITRTVVGLPDDENNGYYFTGDELYSGSNWPDPSLSLWQDILQKQVDTEPDKFFFNFAGSSGQFIMAPKDLADSEIRTIPYKKLQFDYSTSTKEWTITTESGIRYIFGGSGYIETNTDYSSSYPSSVPSNQGESYISSWFLRRIEWPNTDHKINLYYDSYIAERKHRDYREEFSDRIVNPGDPCVPQVTYSTSINEIQSVALDSIVTPGHVISFQKSPRSVPSLNEGSDEYKLDQIDIHTKTGSLLKRYQFTYGYFSGYEKLRLDSVQEIGASGDTKPPYRMYYNTDPFPDPMSTNAIDQWGYYNGKTENNNMTLIPELTLEDGYYEGADRTVDSEVIDLGMLERIEYPTGGYSDFEFEANDYGSIHGDTTLTGYGTPQAVEVISDGEGLQSTTVSISNFDGSAVTANVYVEIDNGCASPAPGCPIASINGPGVSQDFFETGNYTFSLDGGDYDISVDADYSSYGKVRIEWAEKISVEKRLAGGLRIKSISTYSDQTSQPSVRTFIYKTLSDQSNPNRSSGVIIKEPSFHYRFQGSNCSYLSRSSVSKMPLGMTKGSLVGYKEITVQFDGGNEGKRVYRFTTAEDHGDLDMPNPSVWPFFSTTQRDWRRGLETSVQTFDANDNLLLEKSTGYKFNEYPASTYAEHRALATSFVNSDYQVYHDYKVISEWMHLDVETIIEVDPSNIVNQLITSTDYNYDDPSHLQLTQKVETNSDGQQRITEYRYAHEITDDNGPQTGGIDYSPMEGLHMLSQPYSVTVRDSSGTVLSKRWTRWDTSTGWWRPTGEWVWEGGNPEAPVFNVNN